MDDKDLDGMNGAVVIGMKYGVLAFFVFVLAIYVISLA